MKRRTQYQIMVAFMDEMYYFNNRLHLDVTVNHLFPMSENHVFRNDEFVKTVNTINENDKLETVRYGKFIVLRNDRRQVDISVDNRPVEFLDNGVVLVFDEVLTKVFGCATMEYKRTLRSASQFRTAKLLATESGLVDAVRSHASYGWIDNIEGRIFKTVAKVEPYIGLALSSSVSAGTGYTDINIYDYESEVDITGALTMDDSTGKNVIIRYDEYLKKNTVDMELTDGQALISPRALAKAAYESRIIYDSEYKSLELAFDEGCSYAEQMTYELSLAPIWKKIPRAIQFRYGLKKGLAIMVDHDYVNVYGKQFDFVFPDGANKGEVKRYENRYVTNHAKFMKKAKKEGWNVTFQAGNYFTIDHGVGVRDGDVELCIANVSAVEEKHWGMLNYQFLMSLSLDFTNDIKPLATKAVQRLKIALDSPENAMAFIGMIDNGDEDRYEEDLTAVGKIRELLSANPRIFHTKWMQMKIKQLMKKTVQDMDRGRIPVEDSRFVFIVTDPNTLLVDGKPLLKKGECYYNGQVGERAIFRSPLIHKSEAVVINLVSSPELDEAFGHLTNVLVLNAFDDTLPRMGGADCDGDKVFLTGDSILINAVERNQPMIYGDVETESLTPIVWENGCKGHINTYDMRTLTPSKIGQITNYCSAHADIARDHRTKSENDKEAKWSMVTLGRILQGKIIDDAKRGTHTDIDKSLKVFTYPEWLRAGKERYRSYSPIGRLFRWINDIVMPAFDQLFGVVSDHRENILSDYTAYNPEVINNLLPRVAQLEESYRQDVAAFFTDNPELDKDSYDTADGYKSDMEARNAIFMALIQRHKDLLATLDAPTADIGIACLHVAENLQRSGANKTHSYPYVVGTDYIVHLLAGLPNNFKLVRVYEVDGGLWTTSVAVNDGVVYNEEGAQVGTVKQTANGAYDTHTFKEGFFLKIQTVRATQEIARIEEQIIQFELKGFKAVAKMTDKEVIALIDQQTISLKKVVNERGNWLGVMFQGKQIGAVGKETFLDANFAQGRELKVISLQTIKGIIKVTANIEAEIAEETGAPSMDVEYAPVQESTVVLGDYGQMDMFDPTIGM